MLDFSNFLKSSYNPFLYLFVVVGYFLLDFDGKDLIKANASSIKTTCIWGDAMMLILFYAYKNTKLFRICATIHWICLRKMLRK